MDRRVKYRRGLSEFYLPIYDAVCGLLSPEWQPLSGVRSVVEQDFLYSIGRGKPGAVATHARGGESPHNYGCATDWAWVGVQKVEWPKPGDERLRDFQNAVEKAGGAISEEDSLHIELPIRVSWAKVFLVFKDKGLVGAYDFVKENKF